MEIQQPSVVSKGQGKNINSYDSQKNTWSSLLFGLISRHCVEE